MINSEGKVMNSEGEVTKIFITPIGDPKGYREVEYIWESDNSKKYKGKTSIPLFIEQIEPDKTIIITPDTIDIEIVNNEIVNNIENTNIITVPLKGSFKIRNDNRSFSFERKATDLSREILFSILNHIEIENFGKEIQFHFDSSLGLNFLVIAIYENLRYLMEALAFFYDVSISVYNTDPYKPGIEKLHVNKMSFSQIVPKVPKWWVTELKLIDSSGGENESSSPNLTEEEKDCINGIIGGFYYQLPLVIAHFASKLNIDEVERKLEECKSIKRENIKRIENGNQTIIKDKFFYTSAFLTTSLALLLAEIVKRKIPDGENYRTGFRKKTLKEIVKSNIFLFSENELDKLSRQGVPSRRNRKFKKRNFLRNFLAHGGFEYNIIDTDLIRRSKKYKYKSSIEDENSEDIILNTINLCRKDRK